MYEEHGEGYTIYYANDKPKAPKLKDDKPIGKENGTASAQVRGGAHALVSDPNIEIVTKVPGLVWDIRYKVPPKEERRHGVFARLLGRK